MSRFSCAVLGCVAVSGLALGAQTQSVPPTPSPAASSSTITVVGCVEEAVADGSLGGTPLGTSATPADAGRVANVQPRVDGFVLTGARPASAGAVGTAGSGSNAPGAAATTGAADASKEELKTYALEGDRNELAPHKGHRVEITGAVAPPASSGVNRPAGRADDPFQTGVQRLRVQAVKMVAATCETK
jgi:hypothetical protein